MENRPKRSLKRASLIEKGQHPQFNVAYIDAVYQPMKEQLTLVEANGFDNLICSGSPLLVSREVSVPIFGIGSERVIGSYARTNNGGRPAQTRMLLTALA